MLYKFSFYNTQISMQSIYNTYALNLTSTYVYCIYQILIEFKTFFGRSHSYWYSCSWFGSFLAIMSAFLLFIRFWIADRFCWNLKKKYIILQLKSNERSQIARKIKISFHYIIRCNTIPSKGVHISRVNVFIVS